MFLLWRCYETLQRCPLVVSFFFSVLPFFLFVSERLVRVFSLVLSFDWLSEERTQSQSQLKELKMDRLREMLRRLKEELGGSDSENGSESGSGGGSSSSSLSLSSSSSCASSDSDEAPQSKATCSFKDLKAQMETLLEEPERPFRPGDVVVWKDGCKNRKRPRDDDFAVVAHVLDHPIYGDEFVSFLSQKQHTGFSLLNSHLFFFLFTTETNREARTSRSPLTLL